MSELPVMAKTAMTMIDGPERRGSEQRWRVRLADGRLGEPQTRTRPLEKIARLEAE